MNASETGIQMDTEPDRGGPLQVASMAPSVLTVVGTQRGTPGAPGACPPLSRHLGQAGCGPGVSRGSLAQGGQWLGEEGAAPFNPHWWDG